MTSAELRAEAEQLEKAAAAKRKEASALRHAELLAEDKGERLVYAARERCPCGAGLAYDPAHEDEGSPHHGPSFWDCSAILLGAARTDVKHTAQLPFAFYEIKSEGQSSANGATTRPSSAA